MSANRLSAKFDSIAIGKLIRMAPDGCADEVHAFFIYGAIKTADNLTRGLTQEGDHEGVVKLKELKEKLNDALISLVETAHDANKRFPRGSLFERLELTKGNE